MGHIKSSELKPFTCPHCGEAFDDRKEMFDHLRVDNCRDKVRQQIELYESRNGKAHQADLADFADWGE